MTDLSIREIKKPSGKFTLEHVHLVMHSEIKYVSLSWKGIDSSNTSSFFPEQAQTSTVILSRCRRCLFILKTEKSMDEYYNGAHCTRYLHPDR